MATKESERRRISIKLKTSDCDKNEIEYLRMENKRFRRELSSKNSEIKRLEMEFTSYRIEKEEQIRKLTQKYTTKNEEYENLLKSYKQINKRINSKYHTMTAKDKEITLLKSDKSALLNDINRVMKDEQEKYDKLFSKYSDLKKVNKKYKAKYRQTKHQSSYTVDLNNIALDNFSFFAQLEEENTQTIDSQLMEFEQYRPRRKYKPSKKRKSRARQMSQIVTMKQSRSRATTDSFV